MISEAMGDLIDGYSLDFELWFRRRCSYDGLLCDRNFRSFLYFDLIDLFAALDDVVEVL